MPLSEHEQRMLKQIERQFHQDRGLARMPAGPREASRNAKRAAVGFCVGLAALLISFASSWVVGGLGFLAMLASSVVLVQSLRRLAHDHWAGTRAQGEPPPEGQRGPGRQAGGRWWPGWGGPNGGDDDI